MATQRGHAGRLAAIGLLTAGTYAALAAFHPGREDRLLRHALTWGVVALLFALYVVGARRVRAAGAVAGPWVLAGFVPLAALALWAGPFHSTDVHAYVNTGRLQARYGVNPYVTVPADLPATADDPLIEGTWRDNPCVYGPLFAHLAHGLVGLAGEDRRLAVLLFQVFDLLVLLALAALLWTTAGRLGRDPDRVLARFLLLWSPFLLLHFVANAHNDLVLGLCVVGAARLALDGRWWGVLPALAAGAAVKVTPIVVAPFALVWLVRAHGWRRAVASALLGAGVLALASWPYVRDLASFDLEGIRAALGRPAYSIQASLIDGTASLLGSDAAQGLAPVLQALFAAGFVLFVGWRLRRALASETYDAARMFEDGLWTLFVLVLVASAKSFPWYLAVLLPGTLLLPPDHLLRRLTLWISCGMLLVFTGVGKARILDALLMIVLPAALALWTGRRLSSPPEVGSGHG